MGSSMLMSSRSVRLWSSMVGISFTFSTCTSTLRVVESGAARPFSSAVMITTNCGMVSKSNTPRTLNCPVSPLKLNWGEGAGKNSKHDSR